MSIPTSTNFITNNSNYPIATDLINIFQTLSTPLTSPSPQTNYKTSGGYDLGQIFISSPGYTGTSAPTGFVTTINGTPYDLAKVFNQKPYTITGSGTYTTNNNTITFTSGILNITYNKTTTPSVLIVGGGGGGGYGVVSFEGAGGGGAGGVGYGNLTFSAGVSYQITVGSGGTGGLVDSSGTTGTNSSNGINSSISGGSINETAYGGGFGGSNIRGLGQGGGTGGCGGGGSAGWNNLGYGIGIKGTGTLQYLGNNGAPGITSNDGGGGGGATTSGSSGTVTFPGGYIGATGGKGYTWINGSTYGGGGGGGGAGTSYYNFNTVGGAGGTGGGGNGGGTGSQVTSGTINTGGGGGGAYGGTGYGSNGGNGGSGIIIFTS